jgi:UPF0755 protein
MSLFKKTILISFALMLAAAAVTLYLYLSPALRKQNGSVHVIYIKEGDGTAEVIEQLSTAHGLRFPFVFGLLAERMQLNNGLKKGRYMVLEGTNMVGLVRILREGRTRSTNLVIRPLSGLEKFAAKCGEKLEPDSIDYIRILQDSAFLSELGFTPATVYALLLPDTYNVLWHTSADELLLRLKQEYTLYWNEERRAKAAQSGLTELEVATLASIVAKETNKNDEMPMVAGMYINRLRINMPLQADPTIKFALNDAGLKRILNGHLQVESPYNTYLNKGLPPGPICIPSKQAIDAVLNFSEHPYLFMCAKEDFSGYHNFAKDYRSHLINAGKYRKALDARGIQ